LIAFLWSMNVSDEFAFKRVTAPDIAKRKGGAPIVALTAYHAHTAQSSTLTSTCCSSATPRHGDAWL
jgi:hypothetical protein